MSQVDWSSTFVNFDLMGKNSIQIRNELRKSLAHELTTGVHDKSFAKMFELDLPIRADDIEGMITSFPVLDRINWDAPTVSSVLKPDLWYA